MAASLTTTAKRGYKPAMSHGLRIKDLPASERPRERLAEKGADALSHAELVAILLRTGRKGFPRSRSPRNCSKIRHSHRPGARLPR